MSKRGGRAFVLLTDGALKCVCVCGVYVLRTSVCYALLVTRGLLPAWGHFIGTESTVESNRSLLKSCVKRS